MKKELQKEVTQEAQKPQPPPRMAITKVANGFIVENNDPTALQKIAVFQDNNNLKNFGLFQALNEMCIVLSDGNVALFGNETKEKIQMAEINVVKLEEKNEQ